jgi:hypothetical protein
MTQLEGEAPIPAGLADGGHAARIPTKVVPDQRPALHNPGLSALDNTMASPPPVEDQARLLEDALAVVRQQTMLMRRCLETPGKLMDALKCRYELPQNGTTYMGHRRI